MGRSFCEMGDEEDGEFGVAGIGEDGGGRD
jgi:hypothetical protein